MKTNNNYNTNIFLHTVWEIIKSPVLLFNKLFFHKSNPTMNIPPQSTTPFSPIKSDYPSEMDALRTLIAQIQNELENLKIDNESLKKDYVESISQNHYLTMQIKALEGQLAQMKSDKEVLQEENKNLNRHTKELERTCSQKDNAMVEMSIQLKADKTLAQRLLIMEQEHELLDTKYRLLLQEENKLIERNKESNALLKQTQSEHSEQNEALKLKLRLKTPPAYSTNMEKTMIKLLEDNVKIAASAANYLSKMQCNVTLLHEKFGVLEIYTIERQKAKELFEIKKNLIAAEKTQNTLSIQIIENSYAKPIIDNVRNTTLTEAENFYYDQCCKVTTLLEEIKTIRNNSTIMHETFTEDLKKAAIKSINSCTKYNFIQNHFAKTHSILQDPSRNNNSIGTQNTIEHESNAGIMTTQKRSYFQEKTYTVSEYLFAAALRDTCLSPSMKNTLTETVTSEPLEVTTTVKKSQMPRAASENSIASMTRDPTIIALNKRFMQSIGLIGGSNKIKTTTAATAPLPYTPRNINPLETQQSLSITTTTTTGTNSTIETMNPLQS